MTYPKPQFRSEKPVRRFSGMKLLFAGFLLSAPLLLAPQAQAQRVSPMSYELEPSGSKAQQNLTLENTSQTAMTIEVSAKRIAIDGDGVESTTPAEDDFLIFPPQMIIKPGKKQTVRLKYIGDPKISETRAYRVSVKQLPVDLTGAGESAVGMIVNFNTLASVSPKGAQSNVIVKNISRNMNGKWAIELENTGKKMARLSRTEWEFSDASGNKKSFNNREIATLLDRNLVMPGTAITLTMPAVDGLDVGTSTAKITVKS